MDILAKRIERIAHEIMASDDSFDVEVSKGDETFEITISRGSDGRWHEEAHGAKYFRPTSYMSYLKKDDILDWLRTDFDEVKLIDGEELDEDQEEAIDEMSKDDLIDELWNKLSREDKPFRKSDVISALNKFGAKINGDLRMVSAENNSDDSWLKEYYANVTFNGETFVILFDVDVLKDEDGGHWPELASISLA